MIALCLLLSASTHTLSASDDVWVYPHASDPGSDNVMRVWGDGSSAIDLDAMEQGEFSMGYLQFPLEGLGSGKLSSAKLTLTVQSTDAITEDDFKKFPLEVHGLSGKLEEKKFSFGGDVKPLKGLLGTGVAVKDGDVWRVTFDLLAGETPKFPAYFEKAQKAGYLGLSLGSSISPVDSRSHIYRILTKENPESSRPSLKLEID